MARIPEEDIERIKRETDLATLVRSRGIELKKHGHGHLIGQCPFHEEKEPSFILTPAKGLFHCMGCGAAGNGIQFVERFDGISFRHAFELLNDGAAFTAPSVVRSEEGKPLPKQTTIRRLEAPVAPDAEDAELFAQVINYYHERLLATPAALEYLKSRGLHNDEAIEHFQLGFADRTLGLRLPEKNRKAGAEIRTRLQRLGLIRESGHEHFNGSLVVPVYNGQGNVAEVYGRKITRKLRNGTPLHLYLPGPHAGIWNAEALQGPELILCEAPLDALTFWVNGIRNVTFIYGTEGFPDDLFDALLENRVKTVWLAYDNDKSGNRAAARDADRLRAHGVEVYRVKFPHGMDANEYALKITPAPKSLVHVIHSAQWLGNGTQKSVAAGQSLTSTRASSSLVAKVAANPALDLIPEPVEVAEMAEATHPTASPPKLEERREKADQATKKKPSELSCEQPSLHHCGDLAGNGTSYHILQLGSREYRVGGLEKNTGFEVLKITLRVKVVTETRLGQDSALFHLDSIDLTRDLDRRRFIDRAAEETRLEKELIKRDLGKLLLALEKAQEERHCAEISEQKSEIRPSMTDDEKTEALEFLQSPNLVDRISEAFDLCGLVGERANRLAAYLACTSRKLNRPLAVIIQSTSAAGKSTLMEAVLSLFPSEEQIKYSAMTGQSLYYLGETNLKHKVLAIVEEEGAEKASYALKLLQSEGELTIASTGKDPHTGRMQTQEYHVEGPVMIFLTTTAIDIDEELMNRCLVLTVDESKEQTERIHTLQRQARTLEGFRHRKKRKQMLRILRNAQRLLEPVAILNPWANQLTFTTKQTRTRRDHEKYLTLIDSIALLHQYQRQREQDEDGDDYIRVTVEDIELANRLAPELLARSLDELPPQSRRLLGFIKTLVQDQCKREELEGHLVLFSRRELCELSGWSYSQVKRHLGRLQELEYVATRFGRNGTTMRYELLIDVNEPENANHIGLLDVEKLRGTTTTRMGKPTTLTPPCQNSMAKLNGQLSGTNVHLATLPKSTSGALVVVES